MKSLFTTHNIFHIDFSLLQNLRFIIALVNLEYLRNFAKKLEKA